MVLQSINIIHTIHIGDNSRLLLSKRKISQRRMSQKRKKKMMILKIQEPSKSNLSHLFHSTFQLSQKKLQSGPHQHQSHRELKSSHMKPLSQRQRQNHKELKSSQSRLQNLNQNQNQKEFQLLQQKPQPQLKSQSQKEFQLSQLKLPRQHPRKMNQTESQSAQLQCRMTMVLLIMATPTQ